MRLKTPILIGKLITTKTTKDIRIEKSPNLIPYYYNNRNWDKTPLYLIYFEIALNWRINK